MIKHAIYVFLAALLAAIFLDQTVFAYDHIIRPYQSVRAAGMGNVRYTTGFYDENFFANPARVTANPARRFQLPDPMFEFSYATMSAIGPLLTESDDRLKQVAAQAGNNLHARYQMTFPGFYMPKDTWGYGMALITSAQLDAGLRNSYRIEPIGILDVGPAFTFGKKLLPQNELSLGTTAHFTYRAATKTNYNMIDLLQGHNFFEGDGAHIDFDFGGTYRLPGQYDYFGGKGVFFELGAAINNILDGRYSNMKFTPIPRTPPNQPRTVNFGITARQPILLCFTDALLAFEITDLGNNAYGSVFRLIHLGTEARYQALRIRGGINQGYFTAGIGVLTRNAEIDFATYGEELSLNAGGLEDRRYAIRLGFHLM